MFDGAIDSRRQRRRAAIFFACVIGGGLQLVLLFGDWRWLFQLERNPAKPERITYWDNPPREARYPYRRVEISCGFGKHFSEY